MDNENAGITEMGKNTGGMRGGYSDTKEIKERRNRVRGNTRKTIRFGFQWAAFNSTIDLRNVQFIFKCCVRYSTAILLVMERLFRVSLQVYRYRSTGRRNVGRPKKR
jgi:hypothetical protein